MTTVDDDIARIAALRGRPVNYYTETATRREIPPMFLSNLFSLSPDGVRSDLRAYDRLPEEVRRWVRESPIPLNSQMVEACLHYASEQRVESEALAQLPGRLKAYLQRHYRNHPNVRKYA